jgi:nitrite reductase/ring-hydroxylating ferredoxin subunit
MSIRVRLTEGQLRALARGDFVRVELGPQGTATPAAGEPPAQPGSTANPQAFARTALVGRVAGEWRAYANVCRHRALPLDLGQRTAMSDDGRFLLCGQHGALYDPAEGICVAGPCVGLALFAIPVRQEDAASLLLEV